VTVGGTQMPARVSTGDRDAVLRQIRWCAAVQTLVNCHCQLAIVTPGAAAYFMLLLCV